LCVTGKRRYCLLECIGDYIEYVVLVCYIDTTWCLAQNFEFHFILCIWM